MKKILKKRTSLVVLLIILSIVITSCGRKMTVKGIDYGEVISLDQGNVAVTKIGDTLVIVKKVTFNHRSYELYGFYTGKLPTNEIRDMNSNENSLINKNAIKSTIYIRAIRIH